MESLDRVLLSVAPLRRPSGLRRACAASQRPDRSVDGPGAPRADVLSPPQPADRVSGHRGRLDLRLLAPPRRLHRAQPGGRHRVHRQRHLPERRYRQQHPLCRGLRHRAGAGDGRLPSDRPAAEGVRGAVTRDRAIEPRSVQWGMRVVTALVLLFLYLPLLVIMLYAFNPARSQAWPLPGLSTRWFTATWNNADVRTALLTSLKAGLGATTVALVLGSLAAFAVNRFRFFGRETVSFVLILPLALPGIVTGMALNSAINVGGQLFGLSFGLGTIIIGHATFCVVVVFNNVVARLRRVPGSLVEASMDLGADGWQTFRHVVLPNIATALVAGALLAFALSFDEIVVTNFTSGTDLTLPKWIFNNLRLPTQRPEVNVVASVVLVASFIPVYLAQRLARDTTGVIGAARPGRG